MTDQLKKWDSEFGDAYTDRCKLTETRVAQRIALWERVLPYMPQLSTVLEVGCNTGINMAALRRLMPDLGIDAIEPNDSARSLVPKNAGHVFAGSVFDIGSPKFETWAGVQMGVDPTWDLVFTTGVLIHIHPDNLLGATTKIVESSDKYVYCQEYFSHEPREVTYRGCSNMLWTRDFGSYYLDNHPQLECVANGFFWQRTDGVDNNHWWVFKKHA